MNHSTHNSHTKITLLVYVFLIVSLGCKKKIHNQEACKLYPSLYRKADYPIGVAVDILELNSNVTLNQIVLDQFNSVTPENMFKAGYLHPENGRYYWDEADLLVSFAKASDKRIHGHTLIWHNQLPLWIKNYEGNKEEWEAIFKEHIQTIINHFKGNITSWDVVNEAFCEDGTLRNSIWLDKLGPTYIEKAFRYAHEIDPNALLFYNDYNLESNSTKRNSIITYFNNLRERGVKVDGIGLQMHIGIDLPEIQQITESIKVVASHNYKVHLSELDISINQSGKNNYPSQALLEKQANLLAEIVTHYNQINPESQYGITFWGVSDADSWIRTYFNRLDYPLLFDDSYSVKPSYCKLKEIL